MLGRSLAVVEISDFFLVSNDDSEAGSLSKLLAQSNYIWFFVVMDMALAALGAFRIARLRRLQIRYYTSSDPPHNLSNAV